MKEAAISRQHENPAPAKGILVVDDHELIRVGLRALVDSQGGDAVDLSLFEAGTLAEALDTYAQHASRIAVVVLDLNLPDAEGVEALLTFRQTFPVAVVVALSGTDSSELVRNVMALGAVAFFPKSGDLGGMVKFVMDCALHGVAEANCRVPSFALASVSRLVEITKEPDLSERQLQVLKWLLEGKSNREISQLACLSEGTVKNHVSNLLLSFDVRSRAQLISKLRS